jgi:hypothetical protein
MRSPWWFLVAGLIAVAGILGGIAFALPRVLEVGAAMNRMPVQGAYTFALASPGLYTIYVEHGGAAEIPNGIKVSVMALDGNRPVALAPPQVKTSYSAGTHAGVTFRLFTIDRSGLYRVTADASEPGYGLAIGEGTGWAGRRCASYSPE